MPGTVDKPPVGAAVDRPYIFRSVWRLHAGFDDVFTALEDLAAYPAWWPEIRSVVRTGPGTAAVVCRAALPYRLRFNLVREVVDREAGLLRVRIEGELVGVSSWQLRPTDEGGTEAVFDEEVVLDRPLLRRLEPVARPLFRANHELMMRHGQSGLRAWLGH